MSADFVSSNTDENLEGFKRIKLAETTLKQEKLSGLTTVYRYIDKCRQIVHREIDRLFELPHGPDHTPMVLFDTKLERIADTLRNIEFPYRLIHEMGTVIIDIEWDKLLLAIKSCEYKRIEAKNCLLAIVDWILIYAEDNIECIDYYGSYARDKREFEEFRDKLLAVQTDEDIDEDNKAAD